MCLMYLTAFILGFASIFGIGFMSSGATMMGSGTAPAQPAAVTVEAAVAAPVMEATEAAVPVQPPSDTEGSAELLNCVAAEADDVGDMLALVGDTFDNAQWTLELGSLYMTDTATWSAERFGALAYLTYLHYDCGVSEAQIDEYFSPAGFDVLLSNYEAHEQTAACAENGLRLYEFDAQLNDIDYHILYWVEQVSPTRVASVNLVFPVGMEQKQAGYAERLFPELTSCGVA